MMLVDFFLLVFNALGGFTHQRPHHHLLAATWMLEAHMWIFLFAMNDQMKTTFYTKDIHDNEQRHA